MKRTFGIFCNCMVMVLGLTAYADAAVVSRPTAATKAASNRVGGRTDARMPTTTLPSTPQAVTTTVTEPEPEPAPEPEPVPVQTPAPEPVIVVDNKTSMFNEVLSETGANATDDSANARAEAIRRQRAMLDAAGNQGTAQTASGTLTANKCDADLRKCMMGKCGEDFSKCANDSTTTWSEKMESCRRNTKCTGHEYALLAPEILADRDMNVRMSYYNSVINCGDRYNSCIFNECGTMLGKCLAKSDGDRAISKCDKIAKECREQDSGLASRVMSVFGDLRTIATEEAKADEARLREIRDLMRDQCGRFGALFDERSLDCVYTVNFLAGENATTMASKKLYAGDTFQCTPNWFGVDVTTFKENAYRLTRSEKSASSGAMGAGIGLGVGLLTSGAIDRAIATQKADKARQEAEDCSSTLRSTTHVKSAKYDADGNCVLECKKNYKKTDDNLECVPTDEQQYKDVRKEDRKDQALDGAIDITKTGTKVFGDAANVALTGVGAVFGGPEAGASMANATGQVAQGKYDTTVQGGPSELSGNNQDGVYQLQQGLNDSNSTPYSLNWQPLTPSSTSSDTGGGSNSSSPAPANVRHGDNKNNNANTQQSQNQEKYFMNLKVAGPAGFDAGLEKLDIKCDGKMDLHTNNNSNRLSITAYNKTTTCTITADSCDSYTKTVENLYSQRDQYIRLKCPNISKCTTSGKEWINGECIGQDVTLTWSNIKDKLKATKTDATLTLTSITCNNSTLDETNTTINVSKDAKCVITFASNGKPGFTLSSYTAFDIKTKKTLKIKI